MPAQLICTYTRQIIKRVYVSQNFCQMERMLLELLEDYNGDTTSPMNLVLFNDAMSHVCRITRILRQPRGNALLLGMGGSGIFYILLKKKKTFLLFIIIIFIFHWV